jgi:hypothetical protein
MVAESRYIDAAIAINMVRTKVTSTSNNHWSEPEIPASLTKLPSETPK